uniref:Uncharacterized protein n=1 Tax=Myoviridae sp. ctlRg1 TaxID=2826692 RepID=A0A8S5M6Q4_9CAUD|nr:MAG TPA: hypothetical protein [Myoviridae sp. ctlRg1]DAK39158.1 MAG TPA: hypothetical protein [Caudoviricetes sp.]
MFYRKYCLHCLNCRKSLKINHLSVNDTLFVNVYERLRIDVK